MKTGLWKLVYEKIIHLKAKRKGDSILGYMYKTKLVDGWGGMGGSLGPDFIKNEKLNPVDVV